jgi:transcriptional regulator with XRE-family HTH domain
MISRRGEKIMSIGNRIHLLRKQKGMSVTEFANRIGKSRATVYRYESDEIEEMPYTVLIPIAKALDTTPTFLMGYEGKEDQNNKANKLVQYVSELYLTDEEVNEVISFIEFTISRRK